MKENMAKDNQYPDPSTGERLLPGLGLGPNGPIRDGDLGPSLTPEQIIKYRDRMLPLNDPQIRICRFLYQGRGLNIQTGELSSQGSNVIYHCHYWRWDRNTARAVAKDLGGEVRVVWSN